MAAAPERYWSVIWRPGVRELLVFVVLAVVGFLIWEVNPGVRLLGLLGVDPAEAYGDPLHAWLNTLAEPALRCVVALAAGFFFPRGFYLWGLAIAIHTPLTIFLLQRRMVQEGIDPIVGGLEGLLGYVFIEVMFTAAAVVFYTGFAGFGVLGRYLAERRRASGRPG